MNHRMLFRVESGNIPFGHVTSTARKGRKWADKLTPGDTLDFYRTETTEWFGRATVVKVESMPFYHVLELAKENHATEGLPLTVGVPKLALDLQRAYQGSCHYADLFTMVHFIRHNTINPPRDAGIRALESERDYQEALRRAAGQINQDHEVAAYVTFMEEYIGEARSAITRDWSEYGIAEAMGVIRKVAALGLACMEAHGAPMREMPSWPEIKARVAPQ